MTTAERIVWTIGLAAIAASIVYWSTLKKAWKNRDLISAAADVADQFPTGEITR